MTATSTTEGPDGLPQHEDEPDGTRRWIVYTAAAILAVGVGILMAVLYNSYHASQDRELAEQRAAGAAETHTLEEALHVLEALPQPTIAVVQGDAVAGGCELALHCDLRVAGDAARFSMPLARIGLAVPVRLVWKLVETIGQAATRELLFTGEAVDAATAHALGLVNRVVPGAELERTTTALAQQIARNAPLSLRAMKASAQRLAEQRRAIARDDLEELARQVRASADLQEGLAAQRERRTPVFRGR